MELALEAWLAVLEATCDAELATLAALEATLAAELATLASDRAAEAAELTAGLELWSEAMLVA